MQNNHRHIYVTNRTLRLRAYSFHVFSQNTVHKKITAIYIVLGTGVKYGDGGGRS